MKISQKILDLIKQWEGLRTKAYLCPAGVWTIGYGHTGPGVRQFQTITHEQADAILRNDIAKFEQKVSALTESVELTQGQFDALVSLCFNIGPVAFANSTLLCKVKKDPNDPTIKNEFERWCHINRKVSQGLLNRRRIEARLYFS